jgi:Holliday junction resolvase RusA-like endonuclease
MKWKFPISPVAASRPRVSKWGSYYTGTYKEFREQAVPVIEKVLEGYEPTDKNLRVYVQLYVDKPKSSKLDYPRPDIDNYLKSVFDLMNGRLWTDDRQIIFVEATKEWAKSTGYFTVEIQDV